MPFITAAGAGAALSGGASYFGGKKQASAAERAAQLQWDEYVQTRADLTPWMKTGKLALSQLAPMAGVTKQGFDPNAPLVKPFGMEDFEASPAYQFNLDQGMQAINKAAAARGNYYAPATLQDIGTFSQGLARNEFLNAYNMYNQNQRSIWDRIYGLSGSGQNAAAQIGGFGANAAANQGEFLTQAGNARAAGLVGASNAIGGGFGDAYNAYVTDQILNRQQAPTYMGPAIGGGAYDWARYNKN